MAMSEHWQVGKSLTECNQHMMQHEEYSDVTFILDYKNAQKQKDPVHIPALQTLLLARSPVFAAMFTGDLAEKTARPVIHVDDVEPNAFKEMLRFIYTDEVHLSVNNVMSVLYASKKYIMTALTKRCTDFLEKKISPATAAGILQHSMMFDEKDLKNKVLAKIVDEASAVLKSDDFLQLSKEALHQVLQLNLKISKELEVFEACMKWAENKCQELGKRADRENMRKALGENLYLIRFPTMTLNDMRGTVSKHDILHGTEHFMIVLYLSEDPDDREHMIKHLPYHIVPRFDQTPRSLLLESFWYHTHSVPSDETYVIRTLLDCTVSRPVKLKKVFIHACPKEDLCFNQAISVTLVQNGKALFNYAGEHEATPCVIRRPYTLNCTINSFQYAVDVQDVLVQPGELHMNIEAKTKNSDPNFSWVLHMPLSRSAQSVSKRNAEEPKSHLSLCQNYQTSSCL